MLIYSLLLILISCAYFKMRKNRNSSSGIRIGSTPKMLDLVWATSYLVTTNFNYRLIFLIPGTLYLLHKCDSISKIETGCRMTLLWLATVINGIGATIFNSISLVVFTLIVLRNLGYFRIHRPIPKVTRG